MNRIFKASGGVIRFLQNKDQLQRWMVSGPEGARIMDEFHSLCSDESTDHHDSGPASQKRFADEVKKMYDAINEMRNPFLPDTTQELLNLDKQGAVAEVIDFLRSMEEMGRMQY